MSRVLVVFAATGALLGLACGGSTPSAPSAADALSETTSSAHVDFHFSVGDLVDAPRQEAFHEWVVPQLGIAVSRRLQYSKYRDRVHMQRLTGRVTNGWADPPAFTVHSIWPWDAHEALHVYTDLIGRPSDFFNEGIAVALSYDPLGGRFVSLWDTTPIHEVARNLKRANALPSIPSIAETDGFSPQNAQVSYPVAGSFVSFVLVERGMPALRVFFQTSARDDRLGAIESRFQSSFGWSLTEAETRWRDFLQ